LKRLGITTAASLAAVVLFLLATLPPAPRAFPLDGADQDLVRRTVRGAYHIHTTRSDGAESVEDVAAAAARAGLQLAIFTDHGDGTRRPDPPRYIDGVLCLDGVEISTDDGHYVGLGLPAAPYPLGGHASAVVEDVARLGGIGIVAHPFHPNPQLSWTAWDLPFDGIELLNADVEWRNESSLRLARVLFDYLLRPAASVASVFDRPTAALARWDEQSSRRPLVGLAGADAHGSRTGGLEEGKRRFAPGPGYQASFGAFTNRLILTAPLSGEPSADAALILEAIRARRVYTVIDAVADGVLLGHGPRGFSLASTLPGDAEVRPFRAEGRTRLEVDLPGAPGSPPIPWIISNWTGEPPVRPDSESRSTPAGDRIQLASDWRVEKHPDSAGQVTVSAGALTLQYQLAPGERRSQFVAAVADLAEVPLARISFSARAQRPMRVSVQLRFAPEDLRWGRSIYLDSTEREFSLDVSSWRSADRSGRPVPSGAPRSLLFVVDLVNARPGDQALFTVRDIRAAGPS
jgi:hypothetical protein